MAPMTRGMYNYHSFFTDHVAPILGGSLFFCCLPFVAFSIIMCTIWDYLDKHYIKLIEFLQQSKQANKFYESCNKYVKYPSDNFLVPLAIWLGVGLPSILIIFGVINNRYIACNSIDTCWNNDDGIINNPFLYFMILALVYDVIRIGPMYANFAYVYAMCHKEAHCMGNTYSFKKHFYVFNYWIGCFHGVLPGTFTLSHINNHHKYNNDQMDLISTGGYRRDSFHSFMRYMFIWFHYASNISTFYSFYWESKDETNKQRYKAAKNLKILFVETVYYILFVLFWIYLFGFPYAFVTIIYPFFEGNILLAEVNYTWHMFIDRDLKNGEYIESTTILNGQQFIFNEEYHVVHHQYPGLHWPLYPKMYEKHKENYDIVFQNENIFVLGFTGIFRDYDGLVKLVKNPKFNEKGENITAQILKYRMQTTIW